MGAASSPRQPRAAAELCTRRSGRRLEGSRSVWIQQADPLGSIGLSALAAAIPLVFLFWALAVKRLKGHVAGPLTALVASVVAVVVFRMPATLAVASTLHGAAYGLFPIGWIVIAAVFLYRITVETGQFHTIRDSIASLTSDRRLQALLIAFSFGAFLEGAAGFGTPVAISAAMLAGLGFEPLYAAGLCLIANTAPVAFGAIGTPIVVAGQVTGLDPMLISKMVGRQLPLLSLIVPFWLVFTMSGRKGVREVWPAALVSGGSFAVAQWWTSNYLGPLLPDIISSLVSIVCLVAFVRVWQPARTFRFDGEAGHRDPSDAPRTPRGEGDPTARSTRDGAAATTAPGASSAGALVYAWSPFLVLTVLVGLWGIRPVKAALDAVSFAVPFPLIHNAVVLPASGKPLAALFTFNWLSATGTVILISALVSLAIARVRPATALALFSGTLASLAAPLLTIASVLGLAYIGNSSGMTTAMGTALASTGALFPIFSPVLGWLGVFMTGSDTSSNAIFGKLQVVSAESTGVSPILAVAANSSGGVTGKMISPQSIAVACAATGQVGNEPGLFRFTLKHSLLLLAVVALITWLQATVLQWMIPLA